MRTQLTVLVLVLAAVGLGLTAIGATPYVPNTLPDASGVASTLRGSDVPTSTIGYVLVDAAWLIWAWLVLSLVLRVVVDLADAASRGAQWVASLRLLSDAITLPIVRKAVDGALAAVLIANVAVRAVPVATAEPLNTAEPAAMVTTVDSPSASVVPHVQQRQAEALHVVKRGETLWSIAEEYYGSGREYPRIVDANLGRGMDNGHTFSRAGTIEPGWSLKIPLPSDRIEEVKGEYFYTVEQGDTLWGISGRFLGDETRWPELFDANQGAQLGDGHVLHDPDLIWPSLRLRLPPPVTGIEIEADDPSMEEQVSTPVEEQSVPPVTTVDAQPVAHTDGASTLGIAGGAAGVLASMAVGGVLLARRRGRHDLLELPISDEPETDTPVRGGFAELDPARELAQDLPRPQALILAGHVQRALAENELARGARVLLVKYGRARASVVLQTPADGQSAMRNVASRLGTRLGLPIQARTSAEGDVVLECALRGAQIPSVDDPHGSNLVLACVLTDRRELWVNLDLAGHIVVASLPGAGADQVVGGVVAGLAARRAPGELKVWTIAAADELTMLLEGVPHQSKPRASSRSQLEIESALRDVRAELIRRMQQPDDSVDEPEIVLVIGELSKIDYRSQRTTLDMLGTYGPAHHVRLIAATRDGARVADELLGAFGTRLVLRTACVEDSQRLLGQADAADLLGGGQLWARVGGRPAEEAYGVRVRPDLLERLVRLLRARHGLPPMVARAAEAAVSEPTFTVTPLMRLDDVDTLASDTGTVIHVRCFGGFEVRGPMGELVPTVDELTADAAWDVLAVLAAVPEGTTGTRELLEKVWPGVAAETASDLLRTSLGSLHRLLRRVAPALGSNVVRFTSGDTCLFDTRLVVSDVHRFLRLCRAAPHMPTDQGRLAWQRARGLYRGALLDGPGARAWRWAVLAGSEGGLSLRDRYREHYYQATCGLARLAASEGRMEDAISLYRELLAVEPTLEDVVRAVCECYAVAGDYEAIREEERRLNRALRAAYEQAGPEDDPMAYEPEPATLAIFERAHSNRPVAAAVAD